MRPIKERTYLKKIIVFVVGFIIGWFFYLIIMAAFDTGEELSDRSAQIALGLSLATMILHSIISEFNYLKRLEVTSQSLCSNIDIYKAREEKLLGKAEEIVSRFLHHESDIQKSIAASRNTAASTPMSMDDKISLQAFRMTVESYPELKSDQQILKILKQLEESQESILNSKLLYNEYVTYYNSAIVSYPAILFSGMWRLTPLKLYIEDID